jgi:hypothetical protein
VTGKISKKDPIEKKCKEEHIRELLGELEVMKVTNTDITKIKHDLKDIDLWKNRMGMILEDDKEVKSRDSLSGYMKEASVFRF